MGHDLLLKFPGEDSPKIVPLFRRYRPAGYIQGAIQKPVNPCAWAPARECSAGDRQGKKSREDEGQIGFHGPGIYRLALV